MISTGTSIASETRPETAATLLPRPALGLVVFLVFWFAPLFVALFPIWSDGTYYEYGFLAVPLLALFLGSRWKEAATRFPGWENRLVETGNARSTWILLALCLPVIAVLRLFEAADPMWRAPLHAHAMVVLGFVGYLHLRVFGRRGLVLFLPILVLVWLSLPLPVAIETSLIHGLTSHVTHVAATIAKWIGIPATVAGETILLDRLPLHVAEGCSGIRSFQGSMFVGFVLGEFLRLGLRSRIALVVAGVAVAFFVNSARVIYLIRHAADHGDGRLDSLHHLSGNIAMTITFAILAALALAMRQSRCS